MIFTSIDFERMLNRLRWAGHVAKMKGGRDDLNILTGRPTAKSSKMS
jgi:hypothetical protein